MDDNLHRLIVEITCLLALASTLGLMVEWSPNVRKGAYLPSYNLVLVNPKLTAIEQRCTLAHEIGHARLGHARACDPKLELAADRYAGRLLITLKDAQAAASISPHDAHSIADALGVTRHLWTIYAQWEAPLWRP